MNKSIHFFDLDNTLWELDVRAWLILKDKPNSPLIKLSNIQLSSILNGVYKKQENLVEYNGNSYWISDNMFNQIKKKKNNIELSDLGISFIEYTNPMYYEDITILIDNIRHIIGKENIDLGILSSRYDIENDHELLKVLKDKLKDIGLELNKFYYISNFFEERNTQRINNDKMKILLEHLVGYHIEGNHFVPIKQNFYKEVNFYDDELQNINVANNIQLYFEEYLRNTDDDVFLKINNRLKQETPTLYTHLVSNNKLNKYKTTKIVIKEPIKYAIKVDEKIITKFKKFNESLRDLMVGPTKKEVFESLIKDGLIYSIPDSLEDFFNQLKDGYEIIRETQNYIRLGKNNIVLFCQSKPSKLGNPYLYINGEISDILEKIYGFVDSTELSLYIMNLLKDDIDWKGFNVWFGVPPLD